ARDSRMVARVGRQAPTNDGYGTQRASTAIMRATIPQYYRCQGHLGWCFGLPLHFSALRRLCAFYDAVANAWMRSAVSGRSRTRTASESNTAFAIAAAVGPCAASPAPTAGQSGRDTISTSTAGVSEQRRIG